MTRAPRPGVPAMSEEARLSPPLGFSLTMASGTLEGRAEFGLRRGENSPPRHEFEWAREGA